MIRAIVSLALFALGVHAAIIDPITPDVLSGSIEVPAEWKRVGDASADAQLNLVVAIKQQNLDVLDRLFQEVSDPRHPSYGKYMTTEEITAIVSPKHEHLRLIKGWLLKSGARVKSISKNNDIMHATVSVSKAETMLNTKFHQFKHTSRNVTLIRSVTSYHAPEDVSAALDFVGGHIGFPLISAGPRPSSAMQVSVTPAILRQRYNVTQKGGNSKNLQAVAEFQEQYLSTSDLSSFCQQFAPNIDCKVEKVVGQNNPSDPGVEAMLDIEYIMGVGADVPTQFWSTPNFDFWSDLTTWITKINNMNDGPHVHSVSYGDQAEGPAGTYKTRLNTEFQKTGVKGISIIFASGDSGSGCHACAYFEPSFPATSPWVTSVGATRFLGDSVGPEGAVQQFKSGGGFSRYFDRPSYQTTAVENYITKYPQPPQSFWKKGGRATPDVAALGIGFQVVVDGGVSNVGGTSASAPTFSAIVSLLNEIRLNNGGKTLGFLNPWIYQTFAKDSSAFFDVTVGDNSYGCCSPGFKCQPGWDAITGVGTPNFEVLKKHI